VRILLADDDLLLRTILTSLVRRMGHEPIATTNGEEAWEAFEAHPPRFVISDWLMPRLTGVELCRRIRASGSAHRPYVILVTTLSSKERVLEGFQAGADDYIAKPFDAAIFESRVSAGIRVVRDALAAEERIHRDVVGKFQGVLGPDHPELRSSLEALSRIYVDQHAYAKARAFLRRQIEVARTARDVAMEATLRGQIEDVSALEASERDALPVASEGVVQ
jgi:DNA-binding response OmpR family regulator